MSEVIVAQRMWQRRDSAANWSSVNPVLAAGEIGVELATHPLPRKMKVGDGVTAWNSLPYIGSDPLPAYVGVTFDGGGSDIVSGSQCDIHIPYSFTISRVVLIADVSGSIVIDVWKDSYASYPPTVADSITASAKPTLASASKYTDSTLTGWNKTVAADSTFRFNVDSCTGIKRCSLLIEGTRT